MDAGGLGGHRREASMISEPGEQSRATNERLSRIRNRNDQSRRSGEGRLVLGTLHAEGPPCVSSVKTTVPDRRCGEAFCVSARQLYQPNATSSSAFPDVGNLMICRIYDPRRRKSGLALLASLPIVDETLVSTCACFVTRK